MKRIAIDRMLNGVLLLSLAMALSFCAGEGGQKIEKGVIKSDTTWSKNILIKGDVEIAPGVTLTITPGTVVKFAKIEANGPGNLHKTNTNNFSVAELIVRGKLIARGTKDRMILFTSAEKSPRPGDWGAINFLDSKDNILEYCEVSFADTGIHGHGVQANVQNCYLHDNGVAIAYNNMPDFQTKCSVGVYNNRITGNGGGVLFGRQTVSRIGRNQITNNKLYGIFGKNALSCQVRYNDISRNGKGVILYATPGLQLNENNISDNEEYAMSLLEGQIYNVDARKNWWGTQDDRKVRAMIWDKDEDGTLGRVDFSAFAGSAIPGAGVSG